ncbi:uncharacterized protein [Spinacia oleracea]|uniref:Uncharacterized protein isoform X1 n=2 Tax=Spinacia oleracea TaxID=3562 RepID=A0A9R0IZF2_SPIOL|nr:uncharacterized protein LOC110797633 isoform X1 [Spinacia oleracea]XP_056686753.1 uncharacterized protein LOC110797633 isoform X1 [Spinacia oleracea]XP_056686755.1 uncharacterized protein LOC110797633 isoform X1 [Spinacia oleracea]XP_056686756.1 uncharacterized protein LOC110797633 isoform X1 [Spinacia oleracea]XP_056686757.1 uncharacterized protein LOC110797633 isoform X1 [Spinacia oleracea]
MGRYDFEEELSDSDPDDDFLQHEIQALSKACMPPPPPTTTPTSDGGSTAAATVNPSTAYDDKEFPDDDDDDDDLELVRSIKEQYGYVGDINQPLSLKPLTTLPPVLSDDDEDDFETLRAIQRRFSQYCGSNDAGGDADVTKNKDDTCVDESLQNDAVDTSLGSELLDVHGDDFGRDTYDAAENVENVENSSFPSSAQTFMEAIKKNRSCQKFLRNKMLHVEARMEEIKELQKRLKTLRDFQVQCKKKIGRALSQKQDARVQLISVPKQRANKKGSEKNVSAMNYGPLENSHVALYKTAMKDFPLSFRREKWSKVENQSLKKEIIKQFQERVFDKSADVISALEEPGFDNGVDGMISSITNLDITPEIIQDFLGKVDWNKLASRLEEERFPRRLTAECEEERVPRRLAAECEARWLNSENCLINRDNWTSNEDKHLLLLIQKNGIHNWSYIAQKLETNRTPFQCLARYQRSLNASILKREWTEDEDAQLRSAVESFGESNWQAVASVLEGRTGTQCSNRWNKTLLPARQKVGKWSINEDKRLRVAVTLFGHKSWHRIAQFVPGRTQAQCRERWVNVLDPCLNRGQWTEEDDMKLKAAIAEHGYCWSKVAVCIPLRTDNQCRRRWKRLFPNEVLLLKAAKDIKKAALISNFVDRESERPTLGADDFVPLRITDSANNHEKENVPQARNKSRSRKRKRCDGSTGLDDKRSKSGYDALENKKRKAIRSGSKTVKQTGNRNLSTESKKSCESTESNENRELETWDEPIRVRSRRPRRVRLKEIPAISHSGVSQAAGVPDTTMNMTTLVHCANHGNILDVLHGQSTSDSQLRIPEETVKGSNIITYKRKKRSSKLPPGRNVSADTTLVDNCEAMEFQSRNDGKETHFMDAAGSNKESSVKRQNRSRLHLDQSVEWEDLPLVTMINNKRSSKLQPRRSFLTKTTLGDSNCGEMELRTCNDGNEAHSMDAAVSSKENNVKQQKKSRLHRNQSVEWEDLPLAVLRRKTVTRIQKRI